MGLFAPLNPPLPAWPQCRVWIIGASTGIGAATAQALLAAGARVAISARSADKLQAVAGTHANALAQLQAMSGQRVVFHTAVAVVRADTGFGQVLVAPVVVRFRSLGDAEIERYLRLEQPYDCAGSAKCETLGIALLEAIESDDPTALVGLPLIRTCALLRLAGIDVLAAPA